MTLFKFLSGYDISSDFACAIFEASLILLYQPPNHPEVYVKILPFVLAFSLATGDSALCQQTEPPAQSENPASAPTAANPTVSAPPSPNTLLDGTTVKLRLAENLSSESAKTGEQVPFEVTEDVVVDGVTVIPKGAQALATVTEAQPKRRMGRGGKLDVNVDSVRLADGEKAQLRAVKDLSLIHISEPTRQAEISYAVFCL